MKMRYLNITYNEKDKPLTNYPTVLAKYLIDRFGIRPGANLLDTGTGRAEMLNAFYSLGLRVCGCDLEAPLPKFTQLEVKEFDLTRDPFPYKDNVFDVVFSKSVLEHIYNPKHYFTEIYRILAPGGIFIILTPDWRSQWKTFYDESTHVHAYTPLSVRDCFLLNGFQKVQAELFHHHPYLWRSAFWRMVAWCLRRLYTTPIARKLEKVTKNKFLRWAVEQNVLGYGYNRTYAP